MMNMMSLTRTTKTLSGLLCRNRPRIHCTIIIPCRNNNTLLSSTTKRMLSTSTTTVGEAAGEKVVTALPIIEIPNIVSRRVWQQQYEKYQKLKDSQQQKKPNPTQQSTKTSSTSTPPWPKSIQLIGYITGFIIVPYVTIWGIVSNDTLRDDYIFPTLLHNDNNIQDILREHYGEKDLHSISYYDLIQYHHHHYHNKNNRIPYKLLNESNIYIRQQQNSINHEQNISSHLLSIRFHNTSTANNNNESIVLHNVPASIRFNTNNLIQFIQDAISNISKYTNNNNNNNNKTLLQETEEGNNETLTQYSQIEFLSSLLKNGCNNCIGIDFPYNDKDTMIANNNNPTQQQIELSSTTIMTDNNNVEQHDAHEVNILKSQMNVYSLWHYQNPDYVIRQINSKDDITSSSSNNNNNTTQQQYNNNHNKEYMNIRIEQLQHEITELENEMKYGNRTIDSIIEQINPKKNELRQLQYEMAWWKFW